MTTTFERDERASLNGDYVMVVKVDGAKAMVRFYDRQGGYFPPEWHPTANLKKLTPDQAFNLRMDEEMEAPLLLG